MAECTAGAVQEAPTPPDLDEVVGEGKADSEADGVIAGQSATSMDESQVFEDYCLDDFLPIHLHLVQRS
ncbi:unnamed protein product [Protopolystoma xenopodis]|uniref:Uncharacterized protein n=1 Tax=Protopolystoma xenopodis TaxID=117903 RepID=A0A3S4ZN67_9PLAT|nr:unnamed protein product [Protopolystoma xenopodis]